MPDFLRGWQMKRFQPGDRVIVKSERGEGTARVASVDPESGTYRVMFDQLTVQSEDKKMKLENVPGYVPGESMVRRKG